MTGKSNYTDVIQFNRTVIGMEPCTDFNLTPERFTWFKGVINEELDELEEACANGFASNRLDALIDLIYFAYGRVYEIGIMPREFEACWDKVHTANMAKVVGNKGRGSDCDAIKPAGWESPEDNFNLSCDELTLPDTTSDMTKSMIRAIDENVISVPPPSMEALFVNDYHMKVEDAFKDALSDENLLAQMSPVFKEVTAICIKKSQDYNNGQSKPTSRKDYFPFGMLSYAQMLHTKTQRLNSLAQQTKAPNNESIRDTLLDLINYASFAVEAIDKGEI